MSETPRQEFLLAYSSTDARTSPWWARGADSELAHVDVWKPVGDGCYVVVSPWFDLLAVDLVGREPQGVLQQVSVRPQFGQAMFPLGVRTCVTVAKSMLGIRDWRIQTPRQLYNFVRRCNGQVG